MRLMLVEPRTRRFLIWGYSTGPDRPVKSSQEHYELNFNLVAKAQHYRRYGLYQSARNTEKNIYSLKVLTLLKDDLLEEHTQRPE